DGGATSPSAEIKDDEPDGDGEEHGSRVHCDTDQAPVVEPRDGGTTPPSVEIKNDEPDEDEEEHGR
ncbi:unnamed protein product, partial [Ascophyllum nodosum]